MAPFVVLEMAAAIEAIRRADDLKQAMRAAQLFRLPEIDEPVREEKAARLHQAVRCLWANQGQEICSKAGAGAARRIIESQISERAQSMLSKMPRATGAWLLAKTARQNSWTFSGSGELVIESESRFVLRENPVVVGEESQTVVCHFHAGLFEKLFSTLIHPRLVCTEVACHARGDEACVFEFTMARS